MSRPLLAASSLSGYQIWLPAVGSWPTAMRSCWEISKDWACQFEPDWARSNWQSYCVRLPDRVDQKAIMQALLDQGIATRRGIMCSHREAPYSGDKQRHDLRLSEDVQDHSILLPIYAQMTEDELVRVADALRHELNR